MTTYTDSAINDRIKDYLNSRKDQIKIIEYLGSVCKGQFLFNPEEATPEIQDIFLQYPEDFRFMIRRALFELVGEWFDDERAKAVANSVKIVISTGTMIRCNEWSSKYEKIPVSTKCQIVGSLKEETYTKSSECHCPKCNAVMQMKGNEMPIVCETESCSSRKFYVDQETIVKGDVKTVIIQEPMDEVKHGTPRLFSCVVKDDLVFDAYPGQRKILTGVFTSKPKKGSLDRNSIFINTISMQNIDEETVKMPSDAKILYFKQLSKQPNFIKMITASYAPEIKFREMEKLAVIISRIGARKVGRIRGNIHTLLIGNPGTAKSKILEFLPEVTQRCGFAAGGMATGAGITVTMTTLPDKTKFPKGGIVVQSSGSCVALDELNQFPEEDIGKTYSCMESGKIPYNKGGFDQVFIADTTIVAGANPKNGYYVPALGMVKNINLPAPMISRFDLIINVLAEKSETESQQISDHTYMIKKMGVDKYIREKDLLAVENLTEFFNYASSLKVEITDEATKQIDEYVKTMMKLQNSGDQIEGSKQFDRRFIESVLRVAEALTKLHLQTLLTKEYAMMAIDYIKSTLDTFGIKTALGETQIPMEQVDLKDKDVAFEKCWIQMTKDADNQFLPEYDFCKYLSEQYPKIFSNPEKAASYFKTKHDKGDLIHQGGRFKMVK
jgi:replicative DNA helicase Mcm